MKRGYRLIFALAAVAVMTAGGASAQAANQTLSIFAAGTLAVPFKKIDQLFEQKYPDVAVQPQFGGSVKMAREITDLHRNADIFASADYTVVPKYMFGGNGKPANADWYIGFVRNAITFVYTGKSKFANEITPRNWYKVLARKGVEIGRSNPDTDPSGYQTVQMLNLATKYYHSPSLAEMVLANAPRSNIRDTETSLISALQLGQIDYLAIYRSDGLQHHLKILNLPAKINLSDPKYSAFYAQAVAHTKNGDLTGKPIVYAITIVAGSAKKPLAEKYIAFLLGPAGRKVMSEDGFGTFAPAYAVNVAKMPAAMRPLVKPWPGT
jgi:molybdate/tungstate transport system substrate-binding protein